jgi:alpha-tubulin suppressor-like RCC1 family protein
MKQIFTLCLLALLGTTTLNGKITRCFKGISTGAYHIIAIKTDDSLWTWGRNDFGH